MSRMSDRLNGAGIVLLWEEDTFRPLSNFHACAKQLLVGSIRWHSKKTVWMTTNNRAAHQIRPAGIFCGPWEVLPRPQSLQDAHRCALTAPRQSRPRPTLREPSRSRCALTARITLFA